MRFSRRDFLALAVAGPISRSEWIRFADSATELPLIRLTNPEFESGLSAPYHRQFTRRGEALIYWSARDGSRQIYQMDLKTGESGKLSAAMALDTNSLTLSADERSVCYFDGRSLSSTLISSQKPIELYRVPQGSTANGLDVAFDGSIYFLEHRAGKSQVMKVARPGTMPVMELEGAAESLAARPRRGQLLYRSSDGLWLVNGDGTGKRKLATAQGKIGDANWTPSGRSIIYLHVPDNPKELITLREHTPDDNTDRMIAKTSQFERVSANGDASVFAGASRSKAQPFVLVLLRATRRELTLCEHKASDPSLVAPIFSPDSQSVFFVTDRHGKPAIYRMLIDKFISETA